MAETKNELSLVELNNDLELAFKNDQLKLKLNKPIPKGWLKKHPSAKKKVTVNGQTTTVSAEYLPIDKVEFMLDYIFQEWRIEVLREGVIFNSVYVTVRVHYKNPFTGVWSFHDGIGAKSMQLDADSRASDMSRIKAEAVMMSLPSAKSYAIKDACDHLGSIFGRNANRADSVEFESVYTAPEKPDRKDKTEDRVMQLINAARSIATLEKVKNDCSNPELIQAYDKKYKELLNK